MVFAEYFHNDETDGSRKFEKKLEKLAARARAATYQAVSLQKVSILVARKATQHRLCDEADGLCNCTKKNQVTGEHYKFYKRFIDSKVLFFRTKKS